MAKGSVKRSWNPFQRHWICTSNNFNISKLYPINSKERSRDQDQRKEGRGINTIPPVFVPAAPRRSSAPRRPTNSVLSGPYCVPSSVVSYGRLSGAQLFVALVYASQVELEGKSIYSRRMGRLREEEER